MPIERKPGETKDEWMGKCIGIEINNGKDPSQAAAICYAKWAEFAADPSCPVATQDIPTNLKNRQKAIDVAHYGPLDPNLPNEDYWIAKAKMFNDSPENAKKARCANCSFFVQTKKILDCIAGGIGSEADPYQTIKAGDLGYCEAFDFKCASMRTCDAWVAGGPITDANSKLAKGKTASVTDNTWSTEAPISVQLSKISFDYDDTLSTAKGKEMAKRAIERGDEVYIISARNNRSGLLDVADELGIPYSHVYATGSNKAKEEKVKELGISKHIDNNALVVRALPGVGQKFKAVRKVIFNEDFDDATVIDYIEKGFKVHIRSARKIQKKDRKVWNKLRAVGLTEDVMVFGEVKDLDKKYEYDLLMTGQDPILERLKLMGEDGSKYKVLHSKRIDSIQEAFSSESELIKSANLKFVTVKVRYTYEEIEGIPSAKSGSRPFCSQLMSTRTRMYSLEEIASLSTAHLSDMGLPEDVFQYRGGFYRNPDSSITTPTCRHYWKANVVIEQ